MTQRCINHPSNAESFNVVQICRRCTNLLRSHKFCTEVKNHSTLYKSFNVIQLIQRSTNNSTLDKSCYVVQIIQRRTDHSTQYKSFNVVQIFQRCINHYWTLYKSFKSFSRPPHYLRFCHKAILKKFNASHLYGNIIKTSRNYLA